MLFEQNFQKLCSQPPSHLTTFYLDIGARSSKILILLQKMETRFWNTFAADQVVFQNRVFTVLKKHCISLIKRLLTGIY